MVQAETCRGCGEEFIEGKCPQGCEPENTLPKGRGRKQRKSAAESEVHNPVQIPVAHVRPDEAQIIEAVTTNTKTRPQRFKTVTAEELLKRVEEFPAQATSQPEPALAAKSEPEARALDPTDLTTMRALLKSTQEKRAARLAALQAEREKQERITTSAPEIIAFLDSELFPAMQDARQAKDHETLRDVERIIQNARANPEVDKVLRDREQASRQQRVDRTVAEINKDATVASAYQGVEMVRADHSAKPILPAMVIRAGTPVPNARSEKDNNSREFSFSTSPLKEPEVVQVQLFMQDIANRETGDLEPTLFARVVAETPNLHHQDYTYRRGGELGVMRLGVTDNERGTPPFHFYRDGRYDRSSFTVREENRIKDPHDAVKVALGVSYTPGRNDALRELGRQKGAERMEKARTEATVSPYALVMKRAVGTCVVDGTVEDKTLTAALVRHSPEYMAEDVTRMREALEARAKEEGRDLTKEEQARLAEHLEQVAYDVELVAYEPSNAFYAIRGAHMRIEPKNLNVTGKGAVTCRLSLRFMDRSPQSNEAISQVRKLEILLKSRVLAQMQEQLTEEAPSVEAVPETAESPEPAEVAG